jgi:hypothetical protein
MRRPALLLTSQAALLLLGLLFPILFVRFNGHARFGVVALAATYSAAIVGVLVTGFSQSILSDGLSLPRLRRYALGLTALGLGGWAAQMVLLPAGPLSAWLAIAWSVAAQAAVSFVYYYAVRHERLAVMTAILPAEALVRLGALAALHWAGITGEGWLFGSYVLSNASVGLVGLGVIHSRTRGADPDADGRLRLDAAGRFGRWSISGAVLDVFDRAGYGAALPAVERSPFLFFNTLYLTAFGLIANVSRLEVLAPSARDPRALRSMLWIIVAVGLGSAGAATLVLLALGPIVTRWTGFDPGHIVWVLLYAAAYRAAMFVHFAAYAFIERAGRTERNIRPRLVASAVLLAMLPILAVGSPAYLAWASLAVAGLVAFASMRLALQAT